MAREISLAAIRRFIAGATSRLTRQVALGVYAVTLFTLMMLLFPAYFADNAQQREALGEESLVAILTAIAPYRDEIEAGHLRRASDAIALLPETSRIRGGAIYNTNDQLIRRFGEPLYRSVDELSVPRSDISSTRLEAYWTENTLGLPIRLAVRMDSAGQAARTSRHLWGVLGVLALASLVLTVLLMAVIGHMIVAPLLSLRSSLVAASQDPTNAESFTPSLRRGGVLGELTRIIQMLLQRVSQTFREELATFAAMVSKTGDGILAYDREKRLVYANDSLLKICNKQTMRELNEHGGVKFRLDDHDEEFSLHDLLKKGEFKGEVDVVCKGAEPRRCLISAAVLRTRDGRYMRAFASLSDITVIHDAQWALEEKNRQLEDANRIKSEFLAQMSHELRTPLNAIIGFSEILSNRNEADSGEMVETFAKDINDSGHHLLGLINNILDLSKMEAGKQELTETDVDLTDLAQSSLAMVRKVAATRGVNLLSTLPAMPLHIRGDAVRLKQVLLNLLSNAIKFTDAGGSVRLNIEKTNDGVLVTVSDTGIGMNAEDIPRALQPFAQIDSGISRRYEGTGLGLPITAGLIELHGGEMQLQSERGVGTTVFFTLPTDRLVKAA